MPKLQKKVSKREDGFAVDGESNLAVYVDPGDRYVGVAVFERDAKQDAWSCVDAFTLDVESDADVREKFYAWLLYLIQSRQLRILGYEVWRLYNDKAEEQTGSEFEATQMIGVFKWLAWNYRHRVEVVRFLPDFKKATAGILEKRGVVLQSRKRKTYGDHAYDAELQGYYDIIKNREWKTIEYAEDAVPTGRYRLGARDR
jgi:hypothetical protein